MNYTIYKESNGQILRIVQTVNIESQIQNGESYIEGSINDSHYYIENNAAVEKPERPNNYCDFDYDSKQWVDRRTNEYQWAVVRFERKKRLQDCDWTQLSDIPVETKAKWETYRQALRDITNQADPFNIIYPTKPE